MKKIFFIAAAASFIVFAANFASAEAIKAHLKDGTMVEINGDNMNIVKDGHATKAEDGEYKVMIDDKETNVTVHEGKASMK
ncbi:MAG: hypothetical protein ACK4OM_03840 [Alphaproteobacteria bacterium]